MLNTIPLESFAPELLNLFEETFDIHHGYCLDKGTSLLETLDQISAAEASASIGGRCATNAAQVEHTLFFLEVLERDITRKEVGVLDWDEIWNRVEAVSSPEWDDLKARLRAAYDRLGRTLRAIDDWEQDDTLAGSMAIVVHTTYHLGEIRQELCIFGRPE